MSPVLRSLTSRKHVIAVLVLTAAALGRICTHEFVNLDDDKFIAANPAFHPATFRTLAGQWRGPHAHLYAPVTETIWWLIAQVASVREDGGMALNPWVFHAASLAVHLANVLLVWHLLRRFSRSAWAAAIGAGVFAIHPIQVEAVAWASELKDLLAACFSLMAVECLIEATAQQTQRLSTRTLWIAAATACYCAAMLSKPSAVILPVVAAAVLWALCRPIRAWGAALLIGVVLAIPIMWITRSAQPAPDVAPPSMEIRPLVAADALAFYVGKFFWPAGLTVDYGRTPARVIRSGAIGWTWSIPAAITLLAFVAVRSRGARPLAAGWIIFVAAALPNLGLVPFDFQAISTVADHYVYFGLFGVAIAVACLLDRLPAAWPVLAAAATIIALWGVLAFRRAGWWTDSAALWSRAIDVNPKSELAWVNLGALRLEQGNAAGAVDALMRARELDPRDSFVHMNLAKAQLSLGNTVAAADSAIDLAHAYQRRSDYDPKLTAAVLQKFAAEIGAMGDLGSARRLYDAAAALAK